MKKIDELRERVQELGAIHGLFSHPQGWSTCECHLAKILRERSARMEKLLKLGKPRKAKR